MTAPAAPPDQPAQPVWALRRLAASSTIYVGADALARGLGLLLLPLYAHFLSPADYGIVAVVGTVGIVLGILFGLGLNGAVTRMYFEAATVHERKVLYGTVLVFLLVFGALAGVTLEILGAVGVLDLFQGIPYDPYLRYAVWIAYAGLFLELAIAIFIVQEEFWRVAALTLTGAIATLVFNVTFVVLLEQGALGALRALLFTSVTMSIVGVVLVARRAALALSWSVMSTALAFSLPLVPHLLAGWILFVSDRLILERYVSQAEVGVYALGAAIAGIAVLVTDGLGRAFGPPMLRQLKEHEGESHAARLGTLWVAALVWGTVGVIVLGGDVVRIVTPDQFHGAASIVPWVAAGFLAFGVYNVLSQPMWYVMRTRLLPVFTAIAGAVNIGLNLLLVPEFGIEAAAWTTFVGFAVLALLVGWYCPRLHRIPWEYGRWLKLFAAGAAVCVVGATLKETTVMTVTIEVVLVAIAFPLLLGGMQFFTPGDRHRLRAALAAGARYVRFGSR